MDPMNLHPRDDPSLEDSVRTVQDFASMLSEMQEVDSWNDLLSAVLRREHHPAFRSDMELVKVVLRRLLDMLLLSPGCQSPDVTSRIIEAYRRLSFYHSMQLYYRFPFEYVLVPLRQDTTDFAQSEKGGKIFLKYGMGIHEGIVDCAFRTDDFLLMKVLVTYNLTFICQKFGPTDMEMWFKAISYIQLDSWNVQDGLRRHNFIQALERSRGRMTSRRTPFITRCLQAVNWMLCDDETRGRTHALMLDQLFDSLPDSLVTMEEVQELPFLQYYNEPEQIHRMVQAFVCLLGSRHSYEPRSLTHLSRCKVRDTIVQNALVTLPCAVGGLLIPSHMKDYLLCCPGWSSF